MRASSTFRQESRPQAAALWLEDHVFFRTGLHVVNSGGQTNLGVVLQNQQNGHWEFKSSVQLRERRRLCRLSPPLSPLTGLVRFMALRETSGRRGRTSRSCAVCQRITN